MSGLKNRADGLRHSLRSITRKRSFNLEANEEAKANAELQQENGNDNEDQAQTVIFSTTRFYQNFNLMMSA